MNLVRVFLILLILVLPTACGVKGNPKPPLTEDEMLLQTERETEEQRILEEKQKKHLEKIKAASSQKTNTKKSRKTN